MIRLRFIKTAPLLLVVGLVIAGCGKKEADSQEAHGADDGHGHSEEAPPAASFKAGKGLVMSEETRKIIGVEVDDVLERAVANQIGFTVQVFGEKHHHNFNPNDHSGCDVHGSGFLSESAATPVKAGQAVSLQRGTNETFPGVVLGVQRALALGESEIVVGVSNAAAVLKPGEFVPARIILPRNQTVAAVPQSAVLRTPEGTFVYAVNGDAYLRTPVKVGPNAEGWVEITDGLLAGDRVVTNAVQSLWLIELRATKGGGHSH